MPVRSQRQTDESTSTAGIITDCYYLSGSAAAVIGLDKAASSDVTAFNANGMTLSGGNPTAVSLKSALNDSIADAFKDAKLGSYPVLKWQNDFEWDTSTIVITPATGGVFTATVNGAEITGTDNKLVAGTKIVLTATTPDPNYLFAGFTAISGGTTKNLGGTAKTAPYSTTYTVTSNATLGASYLSTGDTALTISTKAGLHGKSSVLASKTWQQLSGASITYDPGYGYMYTHGTDGWSMVAATQYVPISTLLSGVIAPANSDYIIVSDPTGSPSVYPTWQQLSNDLYFFPNATTSTTGGSIEGKVTVPSALALSWTTAAVDLTNASKNTAAKALSSAAINSYNSASLRFVYGSTQSDYTNLTANSTIQGNRSWRGVNNISVAKTPAVYTGSIIAAPLKDIT